MSDPGAIRVFLVGILRENGVARAHWAMAVSATRRIADATTDERNDLQFDSVVALML